MQSSVRMITTSVMLALLAGMAIELKTFGEGRSRCNARKSSKTGNMAGKRAYDVKLGTAREHRQTNNTILKACIV